MVSISAKREDFTSKDPLQDVKFLAERILRDEGKVRRSRMSEKDTNPLISKLMPPDLLESVYERKPMRVHLTRKTLNSYIELYFTSPDKVWDNLSMLRRFLTMHFLCNDPSSDRFDTVPVTLVNANLPEIMMDVIKQSNDGDFDKFPKLKHHPLAFFAIEIMGCFVHRRCVANPIVCERLFRDWPGAPQQLVKVLNGSQSWYESLAVVRLFGYASTCPVGCLWLLRHRKVLATVLRHIHSTATIVEENTAKVKSGATDHALKNMLWVHLDSEDFSKVARIMGTAASSLAALLFYSILIQFGAHYEEFLIIKKAVYDSGILSNFMACARQLMHWLSPGRFMSGFLESVHKCLEMDRTMKLLFLDDFSFFREHDFSPGWDSLKYWDHDTLRPSVVAWLVCHALTMKPLIGSNWAAAILVTTLDNASDEVCGPIIRACGNELMDLAHLVTTDDPQPIPVQRVILEALLRHAGFSYKCWDKADRYIGVPLPTKYIPECCLEAAVFCRRATLEGKLGLAERQYRVNMADTKKDLGNAAFRKGRYKEAIEHYTEAIGACPLSARTRHALYYSNRAECYLRLSEPQRAIHDCNRALCLEQSLWVKVHWRRSRACQRMDCDYAAWLDMYCIKDEWTSSKEQSGVDFVQLEESLREKMSILEKDSLFDLERRAIDMI